MSFKDPWVIILYLLIFVGVSALMFVAIKHRLIVKKENFSTTEKSLIATVDDKGDIVGVDPTMHMFYCDNTSQTCTQPFPSQSIKIGSWKLQENQAGELVFSKNNEETVKLSTEGDVWLKKPRNWVTNSVGERLKDGDRIALRSWRNNHLNNDSKNGTTWSSNIGEWETLTIVKR